MHTFVILAYKESKYIEDCIISLLSQSIKSKVIISSSTPSEYLKILSNKYKIKLILNPFRENLSNDWNYALKQADTPLITLAHQDDIYLKDYTENILNHYRKYPKSLIYFTDYSEIIEKKEQVKTFNINILIKKALLFPFVFKKNINSSKLKKLILIFGNPVSCPTVTYNLLNLGEFMFSDEFKVNLDWDAWLRLVDKAGSFTYISKKLMYHRLHRDTETNNSIHSGIRSKEDKYIFYNLWPKHIAFLLYKIYSLSESNNRF
jgi:hypothetical protein